MKNISTGFGLCVAAAAALAYPFVSSLAPSANAVGVSSVAPAVAAAALAQDPPAPTVVWMGVISPQAPDVCYSRLWSDGRMEVRTVRLRTEFFEGPGCAASLFSVPCLDTGWFDLPPPPGGNGFACRTDLNGDRAVDGVDLGMLLGEWGTLHAVQPGAGVSVRQVRRRMDRAAGAVSLAMVTAGPASRGGSGRGQRRSH